MSGKVPRVLQSIVRVPDLLNKGLNATLTSATLSQQWLRQMADAARAEGIWIQVPSLDSYEAAYIATDSTAWHIHALPSLQ